MTSTTAAAHTVTADQIQAGDVLTFRTLDGSDIRRRVTEVRYLDTVIHNPAQRTRTVYPTVRFYFGRGGESLDYAPDSTVHTA